MINNLNKIFREDPFIIALFNAIGIEFDKIDLEVENLKKDLSFKTMSLNMIKILEEELAIKTTGTLEDRRSQIQAKWNTFGKCSLELLQTIANSWRNGQLILKFVGGEIDASFAGTGIPEDLEKLKAALEEAKPAHIPITFKFIWRTNGQLKAYTHKQLHAYTHKELKEKEVL